MNLSQSAQTRVTPQKQKEWQGWRIVLTMIASACLIITLSGCAACQQYVHFPDQSKRIEDPEKARIYVMRPASTARSVSMVVSDGRKTIGCTGPNSYLCWERDPGSTTITGEAEFKNSLNLVVEKGNVYYIIQHLSMGLMESGNRLELVSEEKGAKVLKKCDPPKTQ